MADRRPPPTAISGVKAKVLVDRRPAVRQRQLETVLKLLREAHRIKTECP
jgi:hypothetical protein